LLITKNKNPGLSLRLDVHAHSALKTYNAGLSGFFYFNTNKRSLIE